MPNAVITMTMTQEELALIVEALSAYQHNTRYRNMYEKMLRQQAEPDQRMRLATAA